MNVLVDTSVLLRRLFREPQPLPQWHLILATHDRQLARAARASGVSVIGDT